MFPFLSLAIGLASLVVTILIVRTTDADFAFLTRDPAQMFKYPSYAGFLSNMGVLFWMASATVTAFGVALVAEAPEANRSRALLLALTILSGTFCLDDFFVLHERVPGSEMVVFGGYAVFLAATIAIYRDLIGRAPSVYLVLAGAFFALSIGIDAVQGAVQDLVGPSRILFEDGAKFLGAVFWLNFSWTLTLDQARRARTP